MSRIAYQKNPYGLAKTIHKINELARRHDEQLEQLSQRYDASINKIFGLAAEIEDKLEQLSDRHAAAVSKIAGIEKKIDAQTGE